MDPDRDSFLEPEVRADSPQSLHVDFPFDGLDHNPPSVKELARAETLRALCAVVDWVVDRQERERETSITYRMIALSAVLRRPFCAGKTVDEIAREHRLNRVVLHRHMSMFIREFRMKPRKQP